MLLLLLLAFNPTLDQAWATTFVSRPLSETTQKSPTLVRGKVNSSGYSDWVKTPDGGRRIYTYYEIQVSEVFKGDPKTGTSIQIRELGGEKDGVGLQIAGTAQFSPGEDVVLTLGEKNADGSYDLRGMMTGKFSITRDQAGNEILLGATGEDIEGSADEHHGPWTLSEFRKLVASQSATSHSESNPSSKPSANLSVTPSGAVLPSAPTPTPTASQLQSERDQGAAQGAGAGLNWGYIVAAILLLGGLGLGLLTRKKK